MTASLRRVLALAGGVVAAIGLDQYEGPDSRPELLLVGLGVGALVAALVRE